MNKACKLDVHLWVGMGKAIYSFIIKDIEIVLEDEKEFCRIWIIFQGINTIIVFVWRKAAIVNK
jgi:hypothetical protein